MSNRTIAATDVTLSDGTELWVSTVLLPHAAMDFPYTIFEAMPPYETMVFPKGEWGDLHCERYYTREAAEEGHKLIVERAQRGEFPTTPTRGSDE